MATKKTNKPEEPTTALAVQTAATRELTPGVWKMIEQMAPTMYRAHLFGVTSPEQAVAIMLKGFELGLSMTASFEFVHVIDGKPALSPRGAMAILLGSSFVKEINKVRLTDKDKFVGYECTMTRVNGFTHTSRFTLEDAKRAGLTSGSDMGNGKIRQGIGNWEKYPENMCLWRAIGFAADVVFPDVTAGMTTLMKAPELYGVVLSESGDVIDATSVSVPSTDPLQELVNQYGAEKVMQANDGMIPTNGQVDEVRRKLEASAA